MIDTVLLETNCYDMVIAIVICASFLVFVFAIKCGVLKWQKNKIQAEKEQEKARIDREREKDAKEEQKKKGEEEKKKTKESNVDHDAERLKREIQRQERVKALFKEVCNVAKDKEGIINSETVKTLFELYKDMDAFDNIIKKENGTDSGK